MGVGSAQAEQAPETAAEGAAPPAASYSASLLGAGAPGAPFGEAGAAPSAAASALEAALGGEQFAARGGAGAAIADNAGYIDSAIIRSRFRMRYDTAYNLNSPDRAEFFYAKCGCFNVPSLLIGPNAIPGYSKVYDPRANGPLRPMQAFNVHPGHGYSGEPNVNYQVAAPYFEYAANPLTSFFIETPARFDSFALPILIKQSPVFHYNTYGWSDMNLGFKRAFVAEPDRFYTFQFRTYVPTGSGEKGLGTNHASLEPGLLVFQRLSDRLYFSGELLDWIPVHATDFAGNVLTYGAGLAYNIVLTQSFRVAPVVEFVGWTIMGGKELNPNGNFNPNAPLSFLTGNVPEKIVSASDWTIINGKFGVRIGLGSYNQAGGGSPLNDRHSIYIGYGQSLTGDHWYKNILRLEYNFWF
jgi:hypothetical protein